MSAIATKLKKLGYTRMVEHDRFDPSGLDDLPAIVGHPIPSDYLEFLREFPESGAFWAESVVCVGAEAAPGVPDKLYPLSYLYAQSSVESNTLLAYIGKSATFPDHLLIVGEDSGDNHICLDLRSESFGKVYFNPNDGPPDELYPLAESFTDYIARLQIHE